MDEREVENEMAQSLADEYGIMYFEISCMTGEGIEEMVESIMRQTYEYKVVPEKLKEDENP